MHYAFTQLHIALKQRAAPVPTAVIWQEAPPCLIGESIVIFWKRAGWYGKRYYQGKVLTPLTYGPCVVQELTFGNNKTKKMDLKKDYTKTESGQAAASARASASARENVPYYLFNAHLSLDDALAAGPSPPERTYYHPTTLQPVSAAKWMLMSDTHCPVAARIRLEQCEKNEHWRTVTSQAVRSCIYLLKCALCIVEYCVAMKIFCLLDVILFFSSTFHSILTNSSCKSFPTWNRRNAILCKPGIPLCKPLVVVDCQPLANPPWHNTAALY